MGKKRTLNYWKGQTSGISLMVDLTILSGRLSPLIGPVLVQKCKNFCSFLEGCAISLQEPAVKKSKKKKNLKFPTKQKFLKSNTKDEVREEIPCKFLFMN